MRGRLTRALPSLMKGVSRSGVSAPTATAATPPPPPRMAMVPPAPARAAASASIPSTSGRGVGAWVFDRRGRAGVSCPRRGAAAAAVPAGQASDACAATASPNLDHLLPSAPLRLAPGEVHLWWADAADPGLSPEVLQAYAASVLTPDEAAASGGQPARVLARALVRCVLARYAGHGATPASLAFVTAARGGKPALDPACNPDGLEFNLTHSGGLAGLAVGRAGSGVGLDVEAAARSPRAGAAAVAARHFARSEADALEQVRREAGDAAAAAEFVRLWTLKESFVKATGHGIRGAGLAVGGRGGAAAAADPAEPGASTRGLASFALALEDDGDGRAAAALSSALPGLPLVGGRGRVGAGDATLTGPAGAVRAIRALDAPPDSPWRFILLRPRPGYVASLCVRAGGGGSSPPLRVRAWQGLPGRPAAPLPTGAAGLACSVPL